MVNLGVRRVEDDVAAKHPAAGPPSQCRSWRGRSCRTAISGACCWPRDAAGNLRRTSASPAAGSLGSYVVTRAETQKCSNFWIYLETGKSPQELSVTGGVSQPAENLPSAEDGDGAATSVRKNRYGDVVE
ncbi:transmembrane protein 141 isoform X6 [Corvus hawaiiensis]|uniref:transmembrane protein 141 isoform X7 n=1 Tax=Corvus moneduloides TaxID=1196302 RepID=UPI001361FBBD|nr:transmembrane protein 141 isoform X7 [Corvus moneduloides]XP_041908391.1 transmembrane protein 141 isoform X7 [Corvus kubaryi]XP_048181521.1 transmembrane protein 141 isoform X6 [Corvus hawaiiensis]